MKMKILSLILGVYAIANLVLIIMSMIGKITKEYLIYGTAYVITHLIYQAVRGEGLFLRN
jgi:hypothetical protein